MPVNTENLNPGTKFPFPDEKGKEWVIIRSLNMKTLQEIMGETETEKREFVPVKDEKGRILRNRQLQPVTYTEVTDQNKRNELTWDYTIVDWELFDQNGDKIPCTVEMKVKLMSESEAFATFWAECIEKIVAHDEQHKEELEKNS